MRVGQTATSATNLNAQRHIGINQSNLSKALERLGSGQRINRAADDAAGLAVAETIRTQVRGLTQASANSEDGLNLLNTADGGLQEMQNMLHRVRELVVQGANETYTDSDREKIQGEISQLLKHVDEVSHNTEFNGIKVLRGGSAVKGGAFGFITVPVLSPTIPGIPGSPTVPMVPTVPAVITPMVPTVVDTVASLFQSVGVFAPGPGQPEIKASSLGGLAIDSNGDIYIAGAEPSSGSPPVLVSDHAVIKITSGGVLTPNFATLAGQIGTAASFNPIDGNMYISTNTATQARVVSVTPGGALTAIHNGSTLGNVPPVVFATGIAANPTTGDVLFGTASPLYQGGFAPDTRMNNIFRVTGATSHNAMLGDPGVPILPIGGLSGPLLWNNTGFPNNNHEMGGLPGSSTPGVPNPNGDNLFVQDLAIDAAGTIFFSSRMTAPFETDIGGGVGVPPGTPAAQGRVFMATPAVGGGTDIVAVPISGNPANLGGMALDPQTGDLLVSVRNDNTIRRITNPGQVGQTETVINVGVPVVGISFVTNPINPDFGRAYLSTITASNDIYTLDPPVPMIATIIVSPTVAMSPTIPAGVAVPTVDAVFGPAEFIPLDGMLQIQTGANEGQTVRIRVNDMSASGLSLEGMDVSRWGTDPYGSASTDQFVEDVNHDLRRIDNALTNISTVRATFGAYYNRLEHAKSNVDNAKEHQANSESRIRDTDMARESSELVRQQILSQASTGMLGQIQQINGQLVMGLISGAT
jgi:flagellin-like hook-associated protein FlgL